jgi:glucose/arabinose dehydrogenase/plastocyanin
MNIPLRKCTAAVLGLCSPPLFAATVDITVGDFFFDPPMVNIDPGDTVTWTNLGSMQHTSTSGAGCIPNGLWDSEILDPGESFSLTFDEEGEFPYLCNVGVHCEVFDMQGAITVGESSTGGRLEDPIPASIRKGLAKVRLETLVDGLTAPNWGTHVPGDSGRLFVTDQTGVVWSVDLTGPEGEPARKRVFLDVSARLVPLGIGGPDTYDERGLLGLAFHPDYPSNGLFYTYTSEPVDGPADFSTLPAGVPADHQSLIIEWHVPHPAFLASVPDPASARVLLRIDEPQFNHDGGALNFGPDGQLYISLGDGGEADDQGEGHGENGNGQDPSNLLGSILRIDPLGSNSANGQYGIPEDNPFVGQAGVAAELYAYGFRNPFRFSFDMQTGNMYIADVGQNSIEEINLGAAGGNYGWNLKEGAFFFDDNGDGPGFVTDQDPGVPPGLIDPIAEYDHDEGIAVIGGFVYRGSGDTHLNGRYIFGDYSGFEGGRLFYLSPRRIIHELQLAGGEDLTKYVLGFGQDATGEVYVMGNDEGVPSGTSGAVLKIVPISANRGLGQGDWGRPGTKIGTPP